MRHGSKRKVYVSVLGLALGALVIDQFLPGPASAQASPGAGVAASVIGAVLPSLVTADPDQGQGTGRLALASQLRALTADSPSSLDTLFDALTDSAHADADAAPAAASENLVGQPAPSLKVTAVLVGAETLATINGRTMLIGHTIDGWTLRAVDEAGVLLEREGRSVRLDLERPSLR